MAQHVRHAHACTEVTFAKTLINAYVKPFFTTASKLASLCACILLLSSPCLVADEASPQTSTNFSQPFINATKKAQPSVVSIKSTMKKHSAHQWQRDESREFSPEEFWERFFGLGPERQQSQQKPKFAYGSGFIMSADGYILTNNHVIEDAESVTVQLPEGKEYPAKIIGTDPSTDIALLKIDETNLPFLVLADSSKVETCEWVIAIGNPLGLQASVTTGVISAKGRSDLDILRVEKFFQTDAAINLGNSGGPLVNLNGEVIGMNTAIATHTGGYMGIGFAIPSNLLKDVSRDLIEHGHLSRGYLGVALQRVDADIAAAVGLDKPQGALVSEVVPGSPADLGGLQSGDIILELQGVQLDGLGTFRNTVALSKPGEELVLKVRREGKEIIINTKVGQNTEHNPKDIKIEEALGILLEPITPEITRHYNLEAKSGLLIVEIDPEGIAFTAGLRAGYVILAVNGKAVSSVNDFVTAAENAKNSGKMLLQVRIGQSIRFFSLTTE